MAVDTSRIILNDTTNSFDTAILSVKNLGGYRHPLLYNFERKEVKLELKWIKNFWIFTIKRVERIYVQTNIVITMDDSSIITLTTHVGASKDGLFWSSVVTLNESQMESLSNHQIETVVFDNARKGQLELFMFETSEDTGKLFQTICKKLFTKYHELKSNSGTQSGNNNSLSPAPISPSQISTPAPISTSSVSRHTLNHQYNLNTNYGRSMARKQAQYNYDHGSQKYRDEIDTIKFWAWLIIIGICALIFIIIWNVGGPDAAVKWLK